jgi:gluconolactonase
MSESIKYHIEQSIPLDFYTEGPSVGPSGERYVTSLTGQQILQVFTDGRISIWAKGDCPNGQVILPTGEHWVCESKIGCIAAYTADGTFLSYIIEKQCGGERVQTPNDLLLDSQGNLYFTDSLHEIGKIFYKSSTREEKCIAQNIHYANGIALNNAETLLYVAESFANRIRVYTLHSPGNISEEYTIIELPFHPSANPIQNLPDGLAVDKEDRLWVAHYGMQAVQLLDRNGKLLQTIDTSLPLTSNITFITDTPSFKQILVTGGYGEPGPGGVVIINVYFDY